MGSNVSKEGAPAFTPGPWEFDEDGETIRAEVGAMIASVFFAADFPCLDVSQEEEGRIDAECARNGFLMAAAPDLYAALKDALPFVIVYCSRYAAEHGLSAKYAPDPDEFHPTHKELYDRLNAALKKAAGDSPNDGGPQ